MKCRVTYYEYGERLASISQSKVSYVLIDGYTGDGVEGKFSLGKIKNIRRSFEADKVRKQVGAGIRVFTFESSVYIQNYSENNIYIHSPSYNTLNSLESQHIIRLQPAELVVFFDRIKFKAILEEAVNISYEAVYNLINLCTVCISFVKGWGENYTRQTIIQCPCWIEFTLEEPLQQLDDALQLLGCSSNRCTSTT